MTLKELKEKLNSISDDKILDMEIMLQVNNSFIEDIIIDYVFPNNLEEYPNKVVEDFYNLLNQFSQCELTDICVKGDLFLKNKESKVYLIADWNHID